MRAALLALSSLLAQVRQGDFATYVPKQAVALEYHFYWFENGSQYDAGPTQLKLLKPGANKP